MGAFLTCIGTLGLIVSLAFVAGGGLHILLEDSERRRQKWTLAQIETGDPAYDTRHLGIHLAALDDGDDCPLCPLPAVTP